MKQKTDLNKLLLTLSLAMDFSRHGLMRHHQRVAFISLRIAEELGISPASKQRMIRAALVHDAGVSTWREKSLLHEFDVINPWGHCRSGSKLFRGLDGIVPVSNIILHHHDRWDGSGESFLAGESIPLESRIIHLADRVDVLVGYDRWVLEQRKEIMAKLKSLSGALFDPVLVEVMEQVAVKESFWFDLLSKFLQYQLEEEAATDFVSLGMEDLLNLGNIFAGIIDGKSAFTHRHSRLVSAIAGMLAGKMGYGPEKCDMMLLAGLMHDLGKLTIPESILEKPGPLTAGEHDLIKQHTYYSYRILGMISGFEEIREWAGYHHEKLDGSGYPFHLRGGQLSHGARIMAVADIFSALVEDRPYRQGMPPQKIKEIMWREVEKNHIDGEVMDVLAQNMDTAWEIYRQLKIQEAPVAI
ncbi:HD-GYP domain [Desulfocucumis palustris]|uniref:HD-GYP domain n=1 Tax=Desulfocucumis palustris TaxID=1898651 RepID=A0A2L2XFW6_9FIRM|nr:HD-GYP domain-containing protein [Desulfocucumis palustris]GBF34603.1 HD-GYP domain [Desulfocucumis palustris]